MESPKQNFPCVNCARRGSDGVTRELGVGFQVGMTKFALGKASANSKSRPKRFPRPVFSLISTFSANICFTLQYIKYHCQATLKEIASWINIDWATTYVLV